VIHFKKQIALCQWEHDAMGSALTWRKNSSYASAIEYTYTTRRCKSDAQPRWRAFTFGPFTSSGDTHFEIEEVLESKSREAEYYRSALRIRAFSAYFLGSVDSSMNWIPFPPILQHHYHFFGSGNLIHSVLSNHGSNQCRSEEGGVDCLLTAAPPGFAWFTRGDIGVACQVTDVRPLVSVPLQAWTMAAFVTANDSIRVRQIRLTSVWLQPTNFTYHLTYYYYAGMEMATWAYGDLYFPPYVEQDDLIISYFHTHIDSVSDLIFFQGTPENVFSNLSFASQANGRALYGWNVVGTMLRDINDRIHSSPSPPNRCRYKEVSIPEPEKVGDRVEYFYRKARCWINMSISSYVLLGLHWHPSEQIFRMHSGLRIYYKGQSDFVVLDRNRLAHLPISDAQKLNIETSNMRGDAFQLWSRSEETLPQGARD